jgi:hypothetical protein
MNGSAGSCLLGLLLMCVVKLLHVPLMIRILGHLMLNAPHNPLVGCGWVPL